MTERSTESPYLQALQRRVLIYDGAMGTNIQRHNLSAEDFGGKALEGCNDHLVLTRPDVIQEIHESFLAVGCDVVETCTFQSTPRRLLDGADRNASVKLRSGSVADHLRRASGQVLRAGEVSGRGWRRPAVDRDV